MRTPVRIAIICMVANMVFNLILIWPLKHVGLALATSLSSMLNVVLLFLGLRAAGVYRAQPGWLAFALQVIGGCVAMCLVILWLNRPMADWFAWDWQRRALELGLLIGAGGLAFVVGLLACGLRPRHLRH